MITQDQLNNLTDLTRQYAIYVRQRNRIDNSISGMVRSFLGYDPFKPQQLPDEPVKEYNKRVAEHNAAMDVILDRADEIQKRMIQGKPEKLDKEERKLAQMLSFSLSPLLISRQPLVEAIRNHKRSIAGIAEQLPVAHMAENIRGLALFSLGQLIAQTHDLSNYRSIRQVWKRMGVGTLWGERQGKNVKGDTDKGLVHGYSKRRRTILAVIGDNLVKLNKGKYRQIYDDRRLYEESNGVTKGIHRRAKRYMEKHLLKDIFAEWNK